MFRFYLASVFTTLGLMGYAQYKGWSVMPTQAEEFQRQRVAAVERATRPTWSSSGSGGFSGK